MLTETGRVVAVDADGLWVQTVRRSTCNACSLRQGCGHGLLERIHDGQRGLVRVLPGETDTAACEVGDQVRICIPEALLLRGSLLLYVLPLLTLLVGAAAGAALWPAVADSAAMLGAVLGLLLGLGVVHWHSRRHRDDPAMHPVLLAVLPRGDTRVADTGLLVHSDS